MPATGGLSIDARSGVLFFDSNTVEQALTAYTITARGIGAYTKDPVQEISFEVEVEIYSKDTLINIDGLTLTYQNADIAFVNQKMTSAPQWNIGATDFSVAFSIEVQSGKENGVHIDPLTGVISVVPIYAITSPTTYTITAEAKDEYYTGLLTAEFSILLIDDNGCEINAWEQSDDGFYEISTARQFALIATKGMDSSYRVIKDITMPLSKADCLGI